MANPTDAWQRGLYRGDPFSCKLCISNSFAFAGSAEGERFSGLSLIIHPGPCVSGQGHRTPLLEALMLEIIPKKRQFPRKGQLPGDYQESRLSSLLLSEINIRLSVLSFIKVLEFHSETSPRVKRHRPSLHFTISLLSR